MKSIVADIKVGDILDGWEILEILPNRTNKTCRSKHLACGHLRAWPAYHFASKNLNTPCARCAKIERNRLKIGNKFGALEVVDMRINDTNNALVVCECGEEQWRPYGTLVRLKSCGCGCRQRENQYKSIDLALLEELFRYNPSVGELIRRSDGKKETGSTVNVDGKLCAIMRVCWWIGHKEKPEHRVSGKSLRLKDLECFDRTTRKAVVEKVEACGDVVQPKSGANHMRMSKQCFTDGKCVHYKTCGDAMFLGECLGKEVKVETRYTW